MGSTVSLGSARAQRLGRVWGALVVLGLGCHEPTATTETSEVFTSKTFDAVGSAQECTKASDCAADLSPCTDAACVDGACVSTPRAAGESCYDPLRHTDDCQLTRCDSASRCVVADAPDGDLCGPPDACVRGTCAAGACTGVVAQISCEDGNPCTRDECDGAGCKHTPTGASCDDGDPCTDDDRCNTASCAGTLACNCENDGDCVALDTNKCDGASRCVEGRCQNDPSTAVVCELPSNVSACNEIACVPTSGKCVYGPKEGKACDDKIACTKGGTCTADAECVFATIACEFDCTDEVDEDGDKLVDCDDSDCKNDAACGVPPECKVASDCDSSGSECVVVKCEAGFCTGENVAEGTALAEQKAGDCQVAVCDGAGASRSDDDTSDPPTSDSACLVEPACSGTPAAPAFTNAAAGTDCSADAGDGVYCGDGDAAGTCVACNTAADCPASTQECNVSACVDHACVVQPVAAGTPTEQGQSSGDCQRRVCDGSGKVAFEDDDSDTPAPENDCVASGFCDGSPLAPAFTMAAAGTACGVGLAGLCDGEGNCGECNVDAHCDEPLGPCSAVTCVAHVCVESNAPAGLPLPGQTAGDCQVFVCDGNGHPESKADSLDLPELPGECYAEAICAGDPLAPAFLPKGPGAVCDEPGGAVCNGVGSCVQCVSSDDCEPTGDACVLSVCKDNVCTTAPSAEGALPSSEQQAGDCQVLGCDGAGHPTETGDPSDTPLTENPCLTPSCKGAPLAPSFQPVLGGTPCGEFLVCGATSNPGTAGKCVACASDTECPGGTCSPAGLCELLPTCTDGIKNQGEIDADCAGPCPTCANGKSCSVNASCASGHCASGVCATPTFNGCTAATALDLSGVPGPHVITFPNNGNLTYDPKCVVVKAGSTVTFNGNFAGHPMIGGTVTGGVATPAASGPFVPATTTGTSKSFTMSDVGVFPYYCMPHASIGMNGAVFVVPNEDP